MNKYELHINLRYKTRHLDVVKSILNDDLTIEQIDFKDNGNVIIYTLKCREIKIKLLVNRIERRIGKRNLLAIYNKI